MVIRNMPEGVCNKTQTSFRHKNITLFGRPEAPALNMF